MTSWGQLEEVAQGLDGLETLRKGGHSAEHGPRCPDDQEAGLSGQRSLAFFCPKTWNQCYQTVEGLPYQGLFPEFS